jgi:chromate reductase, NAD(P)H dehydrogenase (quinone)
MRHFTVLALSGSLRKASLNTAMLTMAVGCAPPGLRVNLHRGLGDLPLFNPDLELHEPPSVARLRSEIAMADAVIIASPEYAHGVSGVMKNALDWMVATGVFVDKPVVLWNASPRASIALVALRETLIVMSARLVNEAALELLIKPADAAGRSIHPDRVAMQAALLALHGALTLREHSPDATCQPPTHSLIATPPTLIRPPNGSAAA